MVHDSVRAGFVLLMAVFAACGLIAEAEYRIGKLDVLRIEVAGELDFTRDSATVSDKGIINLGVIGDLKVEGLTPSGIAELIRKSLVEQKILLQPAVTVTVREYRSQWVTILGEVKTTGRYYLRGSETLLDKIAEAGGLTANAGDITLSRSGADGAKVVTIKSNEFLKDANALVAGDVIFVKTREENKIFVSGEVVTGKPIAYVEGMTVYQAVLMAGGVNRFGSKSKVTIKRSTGGKEEMIRVNLSDIEKGKAKDILLLPNDMVVVGRRVF